MIPALSIILYSLHICILSVTEFINRNMHHFFHRHFQHLAQPVDGVYRHISTLLQRIRSSFRKSVIFQELMSRYILFSHRFP